MLIVEQPISSYLLLPKEDINEKDFEYFFTSKDVIRILEIPESVLKNLTRIPNGKTYAFFQPTFPASGAGNGHLYLFVDLMIIKIIDCLRIYGFTRSYIKNFIYKNIHSSDWLKDLDTNPFSLCYNYASSVYFDYSAVPFQLKINLSEIHHDIKSKIYVSAKS